MPQKEHKQTSSKRGTKRGRGTVEKEASKNENKMIVAGTRKKQKLINGEGKKTDNALKFDEQEKKYDEELPEEYRKFRP